MVFVQTLPSIYFLLSGTTEGVFDYIAESILLASSMQSSPLLYSSVTACTQEEGVGDPISQSEGEGWTVGIFEGGIAVLGGVLSSGAIGHTRTGVRE